MNRSIYHVWEGYLRKLVSRLAKEIQSQDWYFSQIPLPSMIYLFKITQTFSRWDCKICLASAGFRYTQGPIQTGFTIIFNMDQAQPTGEHRIYAQTCTCANSSFGFFSSLFLINCLCSSIRLTKLILLQRIFFGPRYIGDDFFQGRSFFRGETRRSNDCPFF